MADDNTHNVRKFSNEVKRHFLEIVSTYSKYQEQIDRKSDISEIADTLGGITEAARELALNEADDWFDKHTVKRNMSELQKLGKQFDKVSVDAKALDQRLHGLYEDMGHILSRYYKVGELTENEVKTRLGMNESKSPCSCGCGTCNEVLTENTLLESAMSELDIIAKESSDFKEFTKEVYKEFPKLPKNRNSLKWLEDIYKTNESVNEDGKLQGGEDDPCWKDYEMVGMKKKNGKEVPNCVPKNENINEGTFIAFYNRKKHEIEAKDLWDAKQKAIKQLRIPKSKQGLLAIKSVESMKNQDFRFESTINEENPRLNKKTKKFLDDYLRGDKINSAENQFAIMHILKGALIDANFHSEAKQLDKFFPKAKQADKKWEKMIDIIQDKGVQISKWAKWDGYDIIDALAYYTNMTIGGGFGEKLKSLKESISESVNEVETITRSKYNKLPKDYKLKKGSQHYIMKMVDGRTSLVPVKIVKETMDESKFGYQTSTSSYINKHKDEYKTAEKINKGNETKFYDILTSMEEKMGHPKFMVWLSNALRGYKVDMYKDPKIKNQSEAEEALFRLSK